MNRYYVTIPEGRIKCYAPSEQEIEQGRRRLYVCAHIKDWIRRL